MKSRNWVKFFLTTLIVGAISTSIIGFAIKWDDYKELFVQGDVIEILSILLWLIGVGFIFSIISQMGFFAYLTVHRFGLGIFRKLWNPVQIVLIAFVFFDLVYFRYQAFAAERGDNLLPYVTVASLVFIFALVIALIKRKLTNRQAFIPALFFMFVVSIIEWFPALRVDDQSWLYLMIFPLLICNAYQLLILPKMTSTN
ncbi:KinB-signaling pathway activation protein [Litchfieldia alkalitelluris]|uniref:KinB-signaling pathway activation protein n=1 Tax=Litchfieldia alkalitelluris TaxID=304268 RepID=UPI000996288B|nr:KinB-signaling pathway activation protein [Litchfieldia alkalitelluris]